MRAEMNPEFVSYVRARERQFLCAAFLVCGDAQAAGDLLQQAFAKLAARWDKVRPESPDAFVRRILYREAISSWRKVRRDDTGALDVEVIDPLEPGSSVSGRVDVEQALLALTPKQRAVVVLRFFEYRSERETADLLGASAATVRSQTEVALERLRAAIPSLETSSGGVDLR